MARGRRLDLCCQAALTWGNWSAREIANFIELGPVALGLGGPQRQPYDSQQLKAFTKNLPK